MDTLASSAIAFTCFASSFLLSSVSSGITIRIVSPSFPGLYPKLDAKIAFSIAPKQLLSKGLIRSCLASGTEIVANC